MRIASFSFPFIRGMAAENQQRHGVKTAAERQSRNPRFFQREPDSITDRPKSRGVDAEKWREFGNRTKIF